MAPTTDRGYILNLLASGAISAEEAWIVRWQFGMLGDFQAALFQLIARADEDNLVRLTVAFPEQVDAFLQWSRGGMAARLRALGLDL